MSSCSVAKCVSDRGGESAIRFVVEAARLKRTTMPTSGSDLFCRGLWHRSRFKQLFHNRSCCSAIIRSANQKANGSRSGGASSTPMSVASIPDVTPQEAIEGAPKVFRQRNSQRLIMEISKAEMASAAAASAGAPTGSLPGSGNPRQGPSGRGRQVRLGLPWRRCPPHLRRVLQAGHDPACAGAPRTGRCSRRGRLRAGHRAMSALPSLPRVPV